MSDKRKKVIKIIWIIQMISLVLGIAGVLLLGLEIFAGHMDPDKITAYAYIAFGTVISGFMGVIRALLSLKNNAEKK